MKEKRGNHREGHCKHFKQSRSHNFLHVSVVGDVINILYNFSYHICVCIIDEYQSLIGSSSDYNRLNCARSKTLQWPPEMVNIRRKVSFFRFKSSNILLDRRE